MRTDNQDPSGNIRDRGTGAAVGAGLGAAALFAIVRRIGLRGTIIAVVALGAIYFFNPFGIRDAVFGMLFGGVPGQSQSAGAAVCDTQAQACDFSARVLGSTEDVWGAQFAAGRLPNYGVQPGPYQEPILNVFARSVSTGCGAATSDVGPFYCPNDRQLYIDPGFYQVMEERLRAPGDFAQAYVIAHEVGHHIQNLEGTLDRAQQAQQSVGRTQGNQIQVGVELEADCYAGVWAANARDAQGSIIEAGDIEEGMRAAEAIGDDTLQKQAQGTVVPESFTHGTSAQRMEALRRGMTAGNPAACNYAR